MADIMADNQTEAVLSMLDRGETDDHTRDKVSAALLRSQTKVLDELSKIRDNLWTLDKLESLVDRRHTVLCSQCPLRATTASAAKEKKEPGWLALLLSSESIRYFVLILVLVWAVIYIKTGAEGVDAIRGAARATMTGGVK